MEGGITCNGSVWHGGGGRDSKDTPWVLNTPPLPYRALTPAPVVPITVMDPTAWSAAPKASWASAAPSTNTRTAAGSAGPAMRTAPVGVWGGWGQRGGGRGNGEKWGAMEGNGEKWRRMGCSGGNGEKWGAMRGNGGEWEAVSAMGGCVWCTAHPLLLLPPPLPQVHRATAAGLPGGCTAQCQVWGL